MFSFLNDLGNYEARKIGRYEQGNVIISTCACSDGKDPYETGIHHPQYRDEGEWIIVESYSSKEAAKEGHDKWVKIMTSPNLPDKLIDCANAEVAQFLEAAEGSKMEYIRKDLPNAPKNN
jgi:hypothetical protein